MLISFNQTLKEEFKSSMNKSVINIRWEYNEMMEWKPFNLFMNTRIEIAYLKKETNVFI